MTRPPRTARSFLRCALPLAGLVRAGRTASWIAGLLPLAIAIAAVGGGCTIKKGAATGGNGGVGGAGGAGGAGGPPAAPRR